MNIAIAVTAWRRPDYLREVLESLARCRGVINHDIYITIDGGYPEEQQEMAADIATFRQSVAPTNPERVNVHAFENNQGCAGNVGHAFRHIFAPEQFPFHHPDIPSIDLSALQPSSEPFSVHPDLLTHPPYDGAIFLEDDTVPTPDFLTYAGAMLERFADDDSIFSISGYCREWEPGHSLDHPELGIQKRDGFTPWGWAIWRDRAEPIARDWFGATRNNAACHLSGQPYRDAIHESPKGSWAWPMNRYWRAGRKELAPSIGRIQNIGVERGAFCPGGTWHHKNHHTENLMSDQQTSATESATPDDYIPV